MYILNQYGFILPPRGFIYHTGHSMQSLEDVRSSFFENYWLQEATAHLARALVKLITATKQLQWQPIQSTIPTP